MKVKSWIVAIILSVLFLGCSTKKKAVERSNVKTEEYVKVDSVKDLKSDSTVTQKVKEVIKKDNEIKSDSGSVEITGKADIDSPFNYYNINGNDTLQVISIIGNANFKIKNNWNRLSTKQDESLFSESLNAVAKYSREAVAKETIKKNSQKIEKINKTVKETGGTFGAYIMYTLWFVVIVCAVWLIYYMSGINFKSIIDKFRL